MITFKDHSTVELVSSNATDDMVARAAWVSFNADKEERLADRDGVGKLINFLWSNRHTSPFEHGIFTFRVVTPIFVAREWQRHRAASYNEMSGRYTVMNPEFYLPRRLRPLTQEGKPGHYKFVQGTNDQYAILRTQMERTCNQAWESYQEMLNAGIAKEVARMILPLSIYTQFYASMNPRNVMGFLSLRAAPDALFEIREAAHGHEDLAIAVEDLQAGVEVEFAKAMPLTYATFNKNRSN